MALITVKPNQFRKINIPWALLREEAMRLAMLITGTVIVSFSYVSFQLPHNIAAGGVSGIAIITRQFFDIPVGLFIWCLNVPILLIGFKHLGRWPFLIRTLIGSTLFSTFTDFFVVYLPQVLDVYPITDDLLLSTIYAGIVGGFGGGFIYRSGSTIGGTGVIGRVIQLRTGLPLSQVYFFADGVITLVAGVIFGWDIALYAFLLIFIYGLAADYVLEGPSRTRTATIITDNPEPIIWALREQLGRNSSSWEITGGYSGEVRHIVFCTVARSQVTPLKSAVAQSDPNAFVTINVGHQALGTGFQPLTA